MDYTKRPGDKIDLIGELNSKKLNPTISIITPFYNGGSTLMETANAVFSQTYPYFEWIIVDDGSKDEESLKKLEELSKMDKRISVYHKENGGPAIARDYGIEKSSKSTKYIFFLDCDDIPDKTMIECLYWTLETHPDASFAYTTMINFGDKEFLWERYLTVAQQKVENLICISSMVRKQDLIEVGCFGIKEKSMYEDWNLWLKLLEKGKKPIRVNAPLFWYRVSSTGEFSRAKKNNKNAMKYVNDTASKINKNVEIIQYPRVEKKYTTVKNYENMILPDYKKSSKKKILFIFPWMVVGGADLFNLDLIKRIDKEKYESIVLTTTPNTNPLRQEFETYASEVYDMATFLDRPEYINFTDYIISSRKVDMVVVSNTQYGYYMIPYLKGKYPTIPFVDYIHSIDMKDPREGFGRCSHDVDDYLTKTYCCNNFTKSQLIERYGKKNVETLYIGTDEEKFDPKKFNKDELKEKYNVPKDKIIISFVARISEEKRPKMFVEIALKLLEKNPNLHFLIAGDGPLLKKVQKLIKSNENFQTLGMIKETSEIYAISDLTINCSSLEGLALTSYESLAMGIPVISTDVGGQTELIDKKVGGIVHYNENATAEVYQREIYEYVRETLRVITDLNTIKGNCRKKIINGFTINKMIKNFEKIIDESIKEEKGKKKQFINYASYNLSLETLHHSYYLYCKDYLARKFSIQYKLDEKNKKTTSNKFIDRLKIVIDRSYAKNELNTILDCLRALKKTFKEFIYFAKFFVKSIPAFFILIYKLLTRNMKKR